MGTRGRYGKEEGREEGAEELEGPGRGRYMKEGEEKDHGGGEGGGEGQGKGMKGWLDLRFHRFNGCDHEWPMPPPGRRALVQERSGLSRSFFPPSQSHSFPSLQGDPRILP